MSLLDNKEIGNRLKINREKMELSAAKYAKMAGVDPSQYSKIEKGELPVTEKILEKLIVKHKLDRSYILHGMNVPRELDPILKSKSIEQQALDLLADLVRSNADLAQSNKSLARSHEELVMKVTGGSDHRTYSAVVSTLAGLREYVIEIGARVNNTSQNEVEAALGIKVVEAKKKLDRKDTPVDEST